jgi:hypothetical protein
MTNEQLVVQLEKFISRLAMKVMFMGAVLGWIIGVFMGQL